MESPFPRITVRTTRPESRSSIARPVSNLNGFKSPRANDSRLTASRSQFSGTEENSEEELATKAIQIQTKRFYIDVKQNKKGKFIKIAEVSQVGPKKRLVLSMSTAAIFRDQLSNFTDHYSTLGPKSEHGAVDENGTLKSEVINRDERRYYYLDLKENSRGRYLRVCMTMPLSRQRFHIAIPAQGMIEIRNALTELLKEFGSEDIENEMPNARIMRVENKLFYFDVGQNKKGTFMRISEVRNNYRTAITLPEKCWIRFKEVFAEFAPSSKKENCKRNDPSRNDLYQAKTDRVNMKVENDISHSESSSSIACTSSSAAVGDAVDTAREATAVHGK